MKKSNIVLLYGLLASILLILLCLYTHQNEFVHQQEDNILSSNTEKPAKSMPLNTEDVEKIKTVEKVQEIETQEIETVEKVEVKPEIIESSVLAENNVTSILKVDVNKSETLEDNKILVENNSSNNIVNKNIFKNKKELKLRDHAKVKTHEKKVAVVDKNLPKEDNKPLVDNRKTTSKKPKKSTNHKSTVSVQNDISKIINHNISFYKSKSQLTEKSQKTLNRVIKILKTLPSSKIIVKGYTDASGKEKTNLLISKKRANSVKHYLAKHGIPLKNIIAKGFGESELLYGDKPYSQLNRRVEIEIRRK